ncbi:hypothetical protein GAPWKB30_2025 [Gilliamella apicola]|nr:hypothetical protein GAPWKB30_2025 [Gilliamella apicola]
MLDPYHQLFSLSDFALSFAKMGITLIWLLNNQTISIFFYEL